jgi:hypothetical protein
MSLRDSYFTGPTGINGQMDTAFAAGITYVGVGTPSPTGNWTTISTALLAAAAQGQTKFSVVISGVGGLNASYLRACNGNNLLLKSFFAGIHQQLAEEGIYDYQCSLQLDVSDSVNTNVVFNFNFGGVDTHKSNSCGCSATVTNSVYPTLTNPRPSCA